MYLAVPISVKKYFKVKNLKSFIMDHINMNIINWFWL